MVDVKNEYGDCNSQEEDFGLESQVESPSKETKPQEKRKVIMPAVPVA